MPRLSLLIVCIGNTCRSPMAEGFARRRWPNFEIMSVGTHVTDEGAGPANEAITVMLSRGIDIKNHKTTKVEDVDLPSYKFIIALEKDVKRTLIEQHGVDASKVIELFVRDPYDGGIGPYIKCANEIEKKLAAISLEGGS